VANLAGVSPITVSRVLRKPGAVSQGLRLRVDAAVKELGYVPNLAASRLASSRSHTIGVIVPTLYNVIFAEYLFALHEVLINAGFQVIVVNSRYSEIEEENAIKALIGQRVEAIIIAGIHHTPLARQLLAQAHLPVIETFELSQDPIDINIGMSQERAGHAATAHLLQQGFRRIAFLTGNLDHRAQSRFDGYRAAMTEGLTPARLAKSSRVIRRIVPTLLHGGRRHSHHPAAIHPFGHADRGGGPATDLWRRHHLHALVIRPPENLLSIAAFRPCLPHLASMFTRRPQPRSRCLPTCPARSRRQ
jgi:DNA-binding LacI/PurR family transcriptional regulator